MNLGAMREMIARDVASRGRGIKPMAVIATVGTTSTASVDPVPEIATICRENKLWLHLDGAYVAGFANLPEKKSLTDGWSEADSIVVNPPKSLFVALDFIPISVPNLDDLRPFFILL